MAEAWNLTNTLSEITARIEESLQNFGGGFYKDFRVGIKHPDDDRDLGAHPAEDVDFFTEHLCANHREAVEAEEYFLLRGMKGGPGGRGKQDTVVFVYHEVVQPTG